MKVIVEIRQTRDGWEFAILGAGDCAFRSDGWSAREMCLLQAGIYCQKLKPNAEAIQIKLLDPPQQQDPRDFING
jgi:hypothetical protein